MPELETEIEKIKVYIEDIKCDLNELKYSYKDVAHAIAKLATVEDRFKSNDESHKLIWEKINRLTDKIELLEKSVVDRTDLKIYSGIIIVIISIFTFISNVIFR